MSAILTEYRNFNVQDGLDELDASETWTNVAYYASAIAFTVLAVSVTVATGLFQPIYIPIAILTMTSLIAPFHELTMDPLLQKSNQIQKDRSVIEYVRDHRTADQVEDFKQAWMHVANTAHNRAQELFQVARENGDVDKVGLRNRAYLIDEKEYLPFKVMAAMIQYLQAHPADTRRPEEIGTCIPLSFSEREWKKREEGDDTYLKFRGAGGLTRDFLMGATVQQIANAIPAA